MAVNWTDAQRDSISARDGNLLVSAAAGSGKTTVLVERVIQMIIGENSCTDIDKLLIVTFTRAAAADMKHKISTAIDKIIEKDHENENALYQRSLLPNATISTIDSFTINFVREYFFRLNISQDFTILDNTESELIEQKVLDEIIDKRYTEGSDVFKNLVELFSDTKSDSNLLSVIKRLNYFITAQAFPFRWLDGLCELYNPSIDINNSKYFKKIRKDLLEAIDYCLSLIDDCFDVLLPDDGKYDLHIETLNSDLNAFRSLRDIVEKKDWDDIKNALDDFSLMDMVKNQGGSKSAACPEIKIIRSRYIKSGKLFSKLILPLFSYTQEEMQKENERLYPLIKELVDITKEFYSTCMEEKRELNSFLFSDISHFAIELLLEIDDEGNICRTDIANEYKNNFYAVLVDEYQDTNEVQDYLFSAISNGSNLFMVGDIKQSIYRFRLAMPDIFNEKKDSFTKYSEKSGSENQKIILENNFRSNEDICGFVNFVFRQIMSRRVGEIDYNEDEYLYCGAENKASYSDPVELNLVRVPSTEESTTEYEARIIARRILDMVNGGELIRDDNNSSRPVRYGDIAVLLRALSGKIDIFTRVFTEYGIPVTAENKINLFENNEIVILLSLLRTIDNPSLDVPLLATLMSVFYGYTADYIAKARIKNKYGNIYSAICAERESFSAILDDLDKYRKYAASMSVESLIRQIISDTSYLSLVSAMGNHEQRKLNVMKLVSLAKGFDSGESVGLTAFIRYVDGIIENETKVDSAEVESYSENCVRFMTIHKSKGLEFPVCILAKSGSDYNDDEFKKSYLLNDKGIGVKSLNKDLLFRYKTFQYNLIYDTEYLQMKSEVLRTLYVAITRAKDKFIAYASFKPGSRNINNYINKTALSVSRGYVPISDVLFTNFDFNYLLNCALLHPGCKCDSVDCNKSVLISEHEKTKIKINVITEEAEEPENEEQKVVHADSRLVEEIREKLSFKYKNEGLSGFAAKRIASSLDDREQNYKFFASKVPSFITGDKLTGAEKGTAMHTFMQYCDFESASADLDSEIVKLINIGAITERQGASLNRDALKNFLDSDLAERIRNADKVYRELSLTSFLPLSSLEDTDIDEKVLVEGVADCIFEEDGKLVIIDYKTDYVSSSDELLSLYKKQLAFYKYAAEKVLKKEVKEVALYSFSLEKPCIYN